MGKRERATRERSKAGPWRSDVVPIDKSPIFLGLSSVRFRSFSPYNIRRTFLSPLLMIQYLTNEPRLLGTRSVVTLTPDNSAMARTAGVRASSFHLLEQDALNELRHDRSDRHLHIPLLSRYPGMHRHILHRELNLNGQTPQLHHLGQTEADGDRPDVLGRRVPVRQDIARVPEAPAFAEEDRGDGLQVHLVRVGLAMLPAEG